MQKNQKSMIFLILIYNKTKLKNCKTFFWKDLYSVNIGGFNEWSAADRPYIAKGGLNSKSVFISINLNK